MDLCRVNDNLVLLHWIYASKGGNKLFGFGPTVVSAARQVVVVREAVTRRADVPEGSFEPD